MFKKWPKIPRVENEIFHITEKIDGTNGCIIIKKYSDYDETTWANVDTIYQNQDFRMWAQSRKHLITPEKDNYGFAKWVQENAEQLINDLGEGYHFGEWWGQGIQRGYNLDHKRFSLFNPTKNSKICHHVPYLGYSEAEMNYDAELAWLISNGSKANPGYMRPEGLVVYAEKAQCYWKIILDK